jgi:ubiquitin-protein ligase
MYTCINIYAYLHKHTLFTNLLIFSYIYILQTHFDGRLFELRIICGPEYPNKPPEVRFTSRINLSNVNQTTGAIGKELPQLQQWNRNMTM